jgi:hypothetical protein
MPQTPAPIAPGSSSSETGAWSGPVSCTTAPEVVATSAIAASAEVNNNPPLSCQAMVRLLRVQAAAEHRKFVVAEAEADGSIPTG